MSRYESLLRSAGLARRAGSGLVAVALLAIIACETDAPTSSAVVVESASLAKGGGGGGGSTTAPTVGSVAPTEAAQDTTIDVNIFGSGFTNGAAATWSLAGDTTKVHVKSTKFVSSTQLQARIIVPANAPVASYDVVVMLIGGKKGVGAELFKVLLGDPTATFYFPLADAGLALKSDGLFGDGTYSVYTPEICGVAGKMFATTAASNSGDATMQTNNAKFTDRGCAAYPRKMTIAYSDGVLETIPIFMNVRQMANTTYSIPIGQTVRRGFAINPPQKTRCDVLRWMQESVSGVQFGGDSVLVTREAADRWHVRTQPPPNNKAVCSTNGVVYNMSLDFTIVSSRPLP